MTYFWPLRVEEVGDVDHDAFVKDQKREEKN